MATYPAPYDWHDAKRFLPQEGEIVIVHQLCGFAKFLSGKWVFVDECGNTAYLAWEPELWRRQYFPSDPVTV